MNDIGGFVAKFVPRDCDDEDVFEFSKSLHGEAGPCCAGNRASPRGTRRTSHRRRRGNERNSDLKCRAKGGEDDSEFIIDREVAFVDTPL